MLSAKTVPTDTYGLVGSQKVVNQNRPRWQSDAEEQGDQSSAQKNHRPQRSHNSHTLEPDSTMSELLFVLKYSSFHLSDHRLWKVCSIGRLGKLLIGSYQCSSPIKQ